MNEMSHSIANEQVVFLEKQVDLAREDVKEASQKLLKFQNQKNIASPTVEIANYQNLIADLEKQKSELLIKMRALPASLGGDNQIRQTLNKNLQAVEEGLVKDFIEAGAIVSTPTCGPCLGGYMGILAEGERCVSTTNRNFVGRMGHIESEIYLSSPAVAAASAITGKLSQPSEL